MTAVVHGRRVTYIRRGCRCPQCTEANTDYIRNRRHRIRQSIRTGVTGGLLCPCWCQTHADYIAPIDIAQGRTWTCGKPDCQPPKGAA